jgi:hypothetical protein
VWRGRGSCIIRSAVLHGYDIEVELYVALSGVWKVFESFLSGESECILCP